MTIIMRDEHIRKVRLSIGIEILLSSVMIAIDKRKSRMNGEKNMNIGFIVCGLGCLLFLFCALVFTLLKDKAAVLISGFNFISKEERKLYDQARMSKDQRNSFFMWAAILGVGAIFSYIFTTYMAIIAFIVWLVVFFKDVHLDNEKAFSQYKIK